MESTDLQQFDLIAFDRDQTLVQSTNPNSKFCSGFSFELLPHRWGALELLSQGKKIAICSNQGGVAAGYKTIEQLYCEGGFLNGLLGSPVMQIYNIDGVGTIGRDVVMIEPGGNVCRMYFRDSQHGYRKPNPGMLLLAKKELLPTAEHCLYVGDRAEDAEASANAGWEFCWSKDFPWERLSRDNDNIYF